MVPSNIVVLTGAGISVESGVPTFRDGNGLWAKYNIDDVATPQGFGRNPSLVNEFYNIRRRELLTVEPNEGHRALVRLEEAYKNHFVLVTQNIDDLHERAGSRVVKHIHGELFKIRCSVCETVYKHKADVLPLQHCANCNTETLMRPDVVWFGEMPMDLDTVYNLLNVTDIFISIGTSGRVYPAANFVTEVTMNNRKARTIDVNPEPSNLFNETRKGVGTIEVPKLVDELIGLL